MKPSSRLRLHKTATTLWVHVDGQTLALPLQRQSMAVAKKSASGAKTITEPLLRAPMPANVIEVKCKLNDQVRSGDLLCVLEAMKMEYQLLAPHDGKVKKI